MAAKQSKKKKKWTIDYQEMKIIDNKNFKQYNNKKKKKLIRLHSPRRLDLPSRLL